jgi:uncharacterized protein YdeI (YjbR/CyaY-like superfamily)
MSVQKRAQGATQLPIVSFKSAKAWESWLAANHASSTGIWLRIAKKDAGVASVSYAEALDISLCYGWIDGQKRPGDRLSWLQKFTPRRPGSSWSQRNRARVAELTDTGRMRPAGRRAVAEAKRSGKWARAYASPATARVPADLRRALATDPVAKAFFQQLDSANRYAVLYRLQTAASAATRARRLERFMAMLRRHETLHPPRARKRARVAAT